MTDQERHIKNKKWRETVEQGAIAIQVRHGGDIRRVRVGSSMP